MSRRPPRTVRAMPPHYAPPTFKEASFTCPSCGSFAQQTWFGRPDAINESMHRILHDRGLATARCEACRAESVWLWEEMIWPDVTTSPEPSEDMPEPVREVYEEARSVAGRSPRAAAALLRLSIQLLCKELDCASPNLSDAIGELVARGLRTEVQRALDAVRVIGNNAVHPGEIQVDADPDLLPALFASINLICEQVITERRQTDSLFELIPQGAKKAIEQRDGRRSSGG